MFELTNVSFCYDGVVKALDAVSMRIESRSAVAVTGANGCGKTTLLKILNGLVTPTRGEYRFDGVLVDGKFLANLSASKEFHRRVGFIFQNTDAMLFCGSVEDEIAFGPRQLDLGEEECRRRVEDCLELLGIGALRHRAPYTLSGGEKRKVAFAAALALNPDALIMDEPLESLDESGRRLVVSLLASLKDVGKTLVFATHNDELVNEVADRRVQISNGSIIDDESVRR